MSFLKIVILLLSIGALIGFGKAKPGAANISSSRKTPSFANFTTKSSFPTGIQTKKSPLSKLVQRKDETALRRVTYPEISGVIQKTDSKRNLPGL